MMFSKQNKTHVLDKYDQILADTPWPSSIYPIQWRILHSKILRQRPPPGGQILSISCSFWENSWQNRMLVLPP